MQQCFPRDFVPHPVQTILLHAPMLVNQRQQTLRIR
ncbi:hypothetical protein Pan44_51740 [Caulifigura coniformis]|uniref:Uncharacterized protein n=1 Tax=Caulifigura coniformis TaxID=2527983 RepID=A0A517SLW8_9PLAN|nr:hypothetical protein Pan44_51740 [Caulifigura coniformis]